MPEHYRPPFPTAQSHTETGSRSLSHSRSPIAPRPIALGKRCRERLHLLALVLEQPRQDLLERSLPIAEPEAVPRRDRIESPVAQTSDLPERVTRD